MEVDGGEKSGSGTILRLSIALAAILGENLHIYNIRKRRSQPGLRPQHLEAVLAAAKLCDADVMGVTLNSQELWFQPKRIRAGRVEAKIGTAGSISMLLLTILPICAYAKNTVQVHVTQGGTDIQHAPTINYLKYVLFSILERMGITTSLMIHRYGYYPKGKGEVTLTIHPCHQLSPLRLEEFGVLERVRGISVCTFLQERRVADRQAEAAGRYLEARGFNSKIDVVYDESNPLQKGSSLVLWAETDTQALLGRDAIGELRKSSEKVGEEAAQNILQELKSKATVDIHLADMLVPYIAMANGKSVYLTHSLTEHLDTNIWLTQHILGTKFKTEKMKGLYKIQSEGS
jgi:RNA 3'-terminal phosphate cyclase (ATP)